METLEQTALALRPRAKAYIIQEYGDKWSEALDEFDVAWSLRNWRGRVQLCVYWLRQRSQAENNGVKHHV